MGRKVRAPRACSPIDRGLTEHSSCFTWQINNNAAGLLLDEFRPRRLAVDPADGAWKKFEHSHRTARQGSTMQPHWQLVGLRFLVPSSPCGCHEFPKSPVVA